MRLPDVSALNCFTLTVNLLSNDGPAIPTTCHWRLVCVETDTTLQDWTSLTVTTTTGQDGEFDSASAEIAVSALLHAMQTIGKAKERKALIVCADKGLSTEYSQEFLYDVVRLLARN